jgi:hypothetical protein
MTTENSLSAEALEQLTSALNQIATDMNSIKSLTGEMASNGTLDHLGVSIELMACRSGALADRMAQPLGKPPLHGGLENWLDWTAPILNISATEAEK